MPLPSESHQSNTTKSICICMYICMHTPFFFFLNLCMHTLKAPISIDLQIQHMLLLCRMPRTGAAPRPRARVRLLLFCLQQLRVFLVPTATSLRPARSAAPACRNAAGGYRPPPSSRLCRILPASTADSMTPRMTDVVWPTSHSLPGNVGPAGLTLSRQLSRFSLHRVFR